MKIVVGAAGVVALLALAGCVETQEMPLAPNAVRLDTQASGLLFTGQTVPQTMRRAAQLTLDAGYTHFRLQDASQSQGSQIVGASVTSYGNFATITPVNARTNSVGVTVIMLRKGDPGIDKAFDAAATLKKYK